MHLLLSSSSSTVEWHESNQSVVAVVCNVAWAGKRNPLLLHTVAPPPAGQWWSNNFLAQRSTTGETESSSSVNFRFMPSRTKSPVIHGEYYIILNASYGNAGAQFGNARPVGCAATGSRCEHADIEQPDSTMPKCSPPEQNGEPSRTFILRPMRKARTGKVGDDVGRGSGNTWGISPTMLRCPSLVDVSLA